MWSRRCKMPSMPLLRPSWRGVGNKYLDSSQASLESGYRQAAPSDLLPERVDDFHAICVPDRTAIQDAAEQTFQRRDPVGIAENPRRHGERQDAAAALLAEIPPSSRANACST